MDPSALLACKLQQRVFFEPCDRFSARADFPFSTDSSFTRPKYLLRRNKIIWNNNLAWKNSQYLATPPLVLRNNVWGTNADDLWWRITTQCFWLVVPRGKLVLTNQRHYPHLVSDTSFVQNFCARFSDVILRGNPWCGVAKCWLISQAIKQLYTYHFLNRSTC